MFQLRRFALLPSLFALLSAPAVSQAQDIRHIVVFGDSLSDTGNDARLSANAYGFYFPGPNFDYTAGRFTDGYDTLPAAMNYRGVWVEQLAAILPEKPVIFNSLDGGKDYAYGFAFTGGGTTYFNFYGPFAITIDNVDLQITHYLATHPKIDDKTLFVVWGGANDILNATTTNDIVNAGINQAADVERLIDAGATQIIVPNLPPLGAIPRLNMTPYSGPVTQETALFNDTLAAGLKVVRDSNSGKHLRIYPMDVFGLFNKIIASPSAYGMTDVTDSSQLQAVNPDTYLFWDGLHPTTHGHNILALTAREMIRHHQCLADEKKKDWDRDADDDERDADWGCRLGVDPPR
ncbi:MAG: SGNH/GDSL hydrolase family protein [Acidobacteriota bacterium]|nr:SGNH/GDSL hydrolase family protein [Acidobacteriota bacterium]